MAGFPLAAGAFGATVAVSFTGATHFCFWHLAAVTVVNGPFSC
jgi:hypothetical protein